MTFDEALATFPHESFRERFRKLAASNPAYEAVVIAMAQGKPGVVPPAPVENAELPELPESTAKPKPVKIDLRQTARLAAQCPFRKASPNGCNCSNLTARWHCERFGQDVLLGHCQTCLGRNGGEVPQKS